MSDLWKGIMWFAVSIVVVVGIIVTGEIECIAFLGFPFLTSFFDSFLN